MEKQLKKQIDDLLDYSLSLKTMFVHLAECESGDPITEEQISKRNSILSIIEKAIDIENEKVKRIYIKNSDIDSIQAYLLDYYDYITFTDFLYTDNEVERQRVYNKILNKHVMEECHKGIYSDKNKMESAYNRVIMYNLINILESYKNEAPDSFIYSYMKYGMIFTDPTYESEYFPSLEVVPLKRITSMQELIAGIKITDLNTYMSEKIYEEYNELIELLYDSYPNESVQTTDDRIVVVGIIMDMLTNLVSSFDKEFIDARYFEFLKMKKDNKNYDIANNAIMQALYKSKMILLEQEKKNCHL